MHKLGTIFLGSLISIACSAANSPSTTSDDPVNAGIDSGGGPAIDAGKPPAIVPDAALATEDASPDAVPQCGSVELQATITKGNVLVLFDQSNSMTKEWENGATRWKVAKEALRAAIEPLKNVLTVGTIFFPSTVGTGIVKVGAVSCPEGWVKPIDQPPQIPFLDGPTFLSTFEAHFGPGFSTIGMTPIAPAVEFAQLALPDPSPVAGKRIVVLLTDGKPTCAATKINGPLAALAQIGVPTYVIGLPGAADAIDTLNQMAQAGGTGTMLAPADSVALKNTFASIADSSIDQCVFTFDPEPPALDDVHLIVTDVDKPGGYEIPLKAGWELSQDGKTATLASDVCQKAKGGLFTSLKFIFGCPESIIR